MHSRWFSELVRIGIEEDIVVRRQQPLVERLVLDSVTPGHVQPVQALVGVGQAVHGLLGELVNAVQTQVKQTW